MVVATKKTDSEILPQSLTVHDTFQFANLRNLSGRSHDDEAMEVAKAIINLDRCVGDGRIKIGNPVTTVGRHTSIAGQFYGPVVLD